MHATHPSTMVVPVDDNMMRSFPLVQVEVKIRVPDQLIGRLIGKNGHCLKKIMDDTATHISIGEPRSQHEIHQYQNPEPYDRIITIKGNTFNSVVLAEKNVQLKLRQFYEQDLNVNIGQQYYNATGVIINSVENIGPYIAPGTVPAPMPMIPRESTYTATAYNPIQMGVSPQSFYIQNPAVTNFSIPTGQYAHNISSISSMPNSVHIKSRVYVPNQIVGILIGTKGQTIKSVIAESGAIISIEGDRDPKKKKKEAQNLQDDDKDNSNFAKQKNSHDTMQQQESLKNESVDTIDIKTIADVEPIADGKINDDLEKNPELSGNNGTENVIDNKIDEVKESDGKVSEQEINGSQQRNVEANSADYGNQYNDTKKTNIVMIDQRGVFIQGYDYQVSKALSWVFQKVAESQNTRPDELVLTCEAIVPNKVIGRIIGKQGQNVKQLQMRSGAHIKVPDDINQNDKNCMEAAVRVVGNFYAVQMVQHHFGNLISEAEWRESREYDERRSRFREGSR